MHTFSIVFHTRRHVYSNTYNKQYVICTYSTYCAIHVMNIRGYDMVIHITNRYFYLPSLRKVITTLDLDSFTRIT